MTKVWTAPRTWANEELVTATMLNEQLRNNLEWLKDTPASVYTSSAAGDYSTTSTAWVDVAAAFSRTLTTEGGDVLIAFTGTVQLYSAQTGSYIDVYFDIEIDGVAEAGDDGLTGSN